MSTPATISPWTRAMAVPALGATVITLCLYLLPRLGLGAAAAIALAGLVVNGRDAQAYRKAGLSPVPSVVGAVLSLLLAAGGGLVALGYFLNG